MGLREMKPINFGSLKAEENETDTALGYIGGGHIWVFKVEGAKLTYCWAKGLREARPINVGDEAENETNTVFGN